jgi:hypothetical protein
MISKAGFVYGRLKPVIGGGARASIDWRIASKSSCSLKPAVVPEGNEDGGETDMLDWRIVASNFASLS